MRMMLQCALLYERSTRGGLIGIASIIRRVAANVLLQVRLLMRTFGSHNSPNLSIAPRLTRTLQVGRKRVSGADFLFSQFLAVRAKLEFCEKET